ncbi:TonB-dependent receptor [Synoicihabitans lomoniglobus]|uniref:TonB-dependent receptor n=1 Tax=Synoicihabitans lomoniglobus TaxID=2909285 RepID=A0AAE9ZW09_9BACT|nr:TonB-dependent receptor [Opitutaceae bacterium LMO-M01]WED65157.1 TonB-dependent receptor [Opitutaceae bacterium LMO-M01]
MTPRTHCQRRSRFCAVALATLLTVASAPAATIGGYVSDLDFNLQLEGAQVSLEPGGRAAFTRRGGFYTFADIAPGEYRLTVRAQGYPALTESITIASAADERSLDFRYSSAEVVELEAMSVTGTVIGQAKAQNIQRAAANLTNAISSDAIGQFVDRNAAEALQRLPGVAVQDSQGEGQFVIIRGADPQLSNITLDGVEVATPEEDGRRTGLNIVTVDQLERIEVSKTWLPNQKGGTIGGTVNLITRSALDRGERYGSLEAAYTQHDIADDASYRFNATYGDVLRENDLSWLGEKEIGFQVSVNLSEDNRGSETLTAAWDPSPAPLLQGDPVLGFVLQQTDLRDFRIKRERTGLSGRLEFKLNDFHQFYVAASLNQFDDDETEQEFGRAARTNDSNTYSGARRLTPAIVAQLGLDPNDPFNVDRINTIDPTQGSLTYAEAIALGDVVYDPALNQWTYSKWGATVNRSFRNTITSDEILTSQVGGEHLFFDALAVDWKYYVSDAQQERESRGINLSGAGILMTPTSGGDPERPLIASADPAAPLDPNLYSISEDSASGPYYNTSRSNDERNGFELDAKYDFELFGLTMVTEFGTAMDFRDKDFAVNNNDYSSPLNAYDDALYPDNRLRLSDPIFFGDALDGFTANFGDDYAYGPQFDEAATLAFLRDPASGGVNFAQLPSELNGNFTDSVTTDYAATEDVLAAYFMQHFELGRWQFIAGVRWEHTENDFTNLRLVTRTDDGQFISPAYWRFLDEDFFSDLVTTSREYDHYLPAFHVRRNIGESLVLRASYTSTISRPTFTDLVPREVPGISGPLYGTNLSLPNFDLEPWESDNFDVSLEYYFQPLGVFSVAAFLKELDGPIYTEVRREVGPNDETQIYAERYRSDGRNVSPFSFTRQVNGGQGELSGYEASFARRLDFLPGPLEHFSINLNYAAFESEVELVTEERLGEVVPLFRQPDETANVSLAYEQGPFFARLSFNRRGKYLNSVRGGVTVEDLAVLGEGPDALDTYVDGFDRIDLIARYRFGGGVQLFVEATNLTNEPLVSYQGTPDRVVSVRYTNPIYTGGLKWNF